MKLLVINGFDLITLNQRDPKIFNAETLAGIESRVREHAQDLGATAEIFQSDNEGDIIDYIQQHQTTTDGIIINPGGLAYSSVALRDCLAASGAPVIELHLSNTPDPEGSPHASLIAPIANGQINGLGLRSYMLAISFFAREYPK